MQELADMIGKRIRQLRKEKRLTIQDISERTRLTKGLIATSLHVPIGYFFQPEPNDTKIVVRKAERKAIHTKSGTTLYLLTPSLKDKKIEFLYTVYEKGGSTEKLYSHVGEEYGIVLKGKLQVIIEDQKYVLDSGDSIVVDSTKPHMSVNIHTGETVAIWANIPPSF